MRFPPGTSGNPNGRKHGSRNHASLMLDKMAAADAADVLRAIIAKAKQGDAECARVLLSRVWQPRRGRPVRFDVPELHTASDVVAAIARLIEQVAAGQLSPDEGALIAGMIETHRKAIETADFEARLKVLEARHDP